MLVFGLAMLRLGRRGTSSARLTAGARRESLGRVLGATQYGVNQAESYVRGLQNRRVRMRLWRTLIDMAPNETWVQQYTRDLLSEAELCGPGPE